MKLSTDHDDQPDDVSDVALVQRCRLELPYVTLAFEQLVRRYQPIVLRTCQSYLTSREDAEEVCQDSFLKVFHGLPSFRSESSFRTWLFRLVVNTCTDRYRQQSKERSKRIEYRAEEMEPVASDMRPSGEEFGRLDGAVGQTLDQLSADDRQILILRHVADLSIRELSEAIELGESATKMRLYRAEERLRNVFRQSRGDTP